MLNTGSLPQGIVEEAARIDAAEDELFGDARGDELPPGLQTSGDRRQRLRDAAQASRDAKRALEAERAARVKPSPSA